MPSHFIAFWNLENLFAPEGYEGRIAWIAQRLAADGAHVIVNYRSDSDGALQVVTDIESRGGKAIAVQADVGVSSDAAQLFTEARRVYGGVDILVNNAGMSIYKPIADFTDDDFAKLMQANLTGSFNLMRELGGIPSTKFFETIQLDDPRLEPVIRIVDILEAESSMSQLAFYQIDTPVGLRNYLNLSEAFSVNRHSARTSSWLEYPILLLTGENDGFLHRPTLGKLKWYPRLKEVEIAHGSHFLVIERPEIVANHIEQWIDTDHQCLPRLKKPSGLKLDTLVPE